MLTIRWSSQFKKDYKKVKNNNIDILLNEIVQLLANNKELASNFKDHALIGNWKGYKECHLKPDLLLIYKQTKEELCLARLASHSEIFK